MESTLCTYFTVVPPPHHPLSQSTLLTYLLVFFSVFSSYIFIRAPAYASQERRQQKIQGALLYCISFTALEERTWAVKEGQRCYVVGMTIYRTYYLKDLVLPWPLWEYLSWTLPLQCMSSILMCESLHGKKKLSWHPSFFLSLRPGRLEAEHTQGKQDKEQSRSL